MSSRSLLAVSIALLAAGRIAAEEARPRSPGDDLIRTFLEKDTGKLSEGFLAGITTEREWEAARAKLHGEYLDMLGLHPLPPRTPLEARTTGVVERDGFRVEKVHFQSRPGLYVTGNLYLPARVEGKLPAVLYLSGHSGRGRDGNKTAFQHHGAWFATHGYAALLLDTLQLGEVAGIHHGTYKFNRWWWQARGYTPAGVECWNAIRALDYLESRPEVDASRIAATGISGGGAATFWVAAADPRVKVAVPVSGMGDLETYVTDRIIDGHCDCMLLVNTHRWEWTMIAALVAPRPLLFANSDKDPIFPMSGNERIAGRLRRLYALLSRPEAFETFVVPGGHDDKPDLRLAAYRFINRWLKDDKGDVTEPELPPIEGKDLRVFPDELPPDALNDRIDETFVPEAGVKAPEPGRFAGWRDGMIAELGTRCFKAPETEVLVPSFQPPALPEEGKPIWLLVEGPGEEGFDWAEEHTRGGLLFRFQPRGVGAGTWSSPPPYYVERSLALLGRTADGGRVWDTANAARRILYQARGKNPVRVIGKGAAGVIAAHAALLEPRIEEVVVVSPPRSHRDGPIILNVLRVCDTGDVLGLLAPRRLTLSGAPPEVASKAEAIYRAAGAEEKLRVR